MEFPALVEAQKKLDAKRAEVASAWAEAGDDYNMDKVKSLHGDSQAKVEWFRARHEEIDALKDKVEELKVKKRNAEIAVEDPERVEAGDGAGEPQRKSKSLGRAFVESAAFTGFSAGQGPTAALDIDIRNTLFETTAGWAPEATRTGYVDLSPERRATVVDFVPQVPTTQSSEVFMRETTFDDSNVAEKAEGTTFGEAALALTQVSLPNQKIPVWLPITDEQLEDVDKAEAYVDGRLRLMIRKRLDRQMVAGDGIAPNLEGTENVSGIQTQAKGADPLLDALKKLIDKISDDNDNSGGDADPSVIFIRQAKWQAVELLRTSEGTYIWGDPSRGGPNRAWGVPVVPTNAVTATKAVAGDYQTHSYLAVKRGIDVQISNSHSDFFINGKLAVRGDIRVCMVHLRPSGFGVVTGL